MRFTFRTTVVAAIVIASALTLTGTQASASANAPPSHTASNGFITASVPAGNFGDSAASGLGGAPYEPGSNTATDQCYRSLTSAFYLLAAARQIQAVVNAACNGATTANLYASGQYGEAPQADQLAGHPDVKKYIVIVGGNDIGFADLFGCFVIEACENTPLPARRWLQRRIFSQPCRRRTVPCNKRRPMPTGWWSCTRRSYRQMGQVSPAAPTSTPLSSCGATRSRRRSATPSPQLPRPTASPSSTPAASSPAIACVPGAQAGSTRQPRQAAATRTYAAEAR